MPTAPPQAQPGSMFGVPGITQRFEQYDTTQAAVTTLNGTAQVPWNNVFPLQKTDVINWWELNVTWANTYTNTGTVSLSPMAPYNLLQNFSLQMQGQFKPLDVISGFDAALFQLIRPMRGSAQMAYQPLLGANPAGTYANAGIPQANLVAFPTQTATSTPVPFTLEIPGSVWFDQYWDLAEDGTVLSPPIATYVSPQYMGGGERIVTPRTSFAAGSGTFDLSPLGFTAAGSFSAFTSSVSIDVRRIGVYASTNPSEMPPVFNWQYQRRSRQLPINASPKIDLPITDYGQVIALFVRLFDPALGTNGVGGPTPIGNVNKCQILYGSNLPKYDDTPLTMQKRFLDQHGFLPPQGTMIWDMALTDTGGYMTNAKALNTLTNANCKVHLEFGTTPGTSAYAVMGVESLVFVSNQ